MLATIDDNKFNYKNKIGEFKYIDIKDLVNNIRNNTISEIHAKKDLNTLNKIENTEIIKNKRRTSKQKELLNLFDDLLLDAILTDKTTKSKSQKDKTLMSSNEDDEMNKTLMSSNEDDEMNKTLMPSIEDDEVNKILMSSNEEDHDETMNQNNNNIIKQLNDCLDKIIDKSKALKDK